MGRLVFFGFLICITMHFNETRLSAAQGWRNMLFRFMFQFGEGIKKEYSNTTSLVGEAVRLIAQASRPKQEQSNSLVGAAQDCRVAIAPRNDSVVLKEQSTSSGYTMVELLLALVVGSVVVVGAYTAYSLVSSTQANYASRTELQEVGVPALRLIERHIRMAGYEALDAELDPVNGDIIAPAAVTDSGNACCDTLTLEYDDNSGVRYQVAYYTAPRTNPETRTALFMDRNRWDGISWSSDVSGALVADYVEDFQAEVSETVDDGRTKLVDVALTLRARNALKQPQTFVKADYDPGNYILSTNDHYFRETFTTSVMLRNVR